MLHGRLGTSANGDDQFGYSSVYSVHFLSHQICRVVAAHAAIDVSARSAVVDGMFREVARSCRCRSCYFPHLCDGRVASVEEPFALVLFEVRTIVTPEHVCVIARLIWTSISDDSTVNVSVSHVRLSGT